MLHYEASSFLRWKLSTQVHRQARVFAGNGETVNRQFSKIGFLLSPYIREA